MIETPVNAEILHESTGLTIHRNDKNKFVVATLHYYADPAKRRKEWIETAKTGMTPSKWNKEYEIDYLAQFGERAFPEIVSKRDLIVVPDMDWKVDEGPYWGGFDYGERNPSSFHVYTYYQGSFYAIWELYKPCKNIPAFAAELKECPFYHRLKYIAADRTIFDNRTHNAEGIPDSVNNLFIKQGVTKFITGNQDEITWIALMRQHWGKSDPSFKIQENCRNLIKEFEEMTFEDYSNEKLRQEQNFKETLHDRNNHALDDCKYFMNSQPAIPRTRGTPQSQHLVDKWYGWGNKSGHRQMPPEYNSTKKKQWKVPPGRFKEFV